MSLTPKTIAYVIDVCVRVWLQRCQRRGSGATSGGCSVPQGGGHRGGAAREQGGLRRRLQGTLLWTPSTRCFSHLLDTVLRAD